VRFSSVNSERARACWRRDAISVYTTTKSDRPRDYRQKACCRGLRAAYQSDCRRRAFPSSRSPRERARCWRVSAIVEASRRKTQRSIVMDKNAQPHTTALIHCAVLFSFGGRH
jgi:hypothetical protein